MGPRYDCIYCSNLHQGIRFFFFFFSYIHFCVSVQLQPILFHLSFFGKGLRGNKLWLLVLVMTGMLRKCEFLCFKYIYVGVTFFFFGFFWYIINKKICVHLIWWCGVIIGLNCTCLIIWLRRICIRLLKFSERRPKFVTILLVMLLLSSFTCSYFIYDSYFYFYLIILLNVPFKLVLRCTLFCVCVCCFFPKLLLFSLYYLELEGLLPNFVFGNIFEYTFLSLCHFPWEWTFEVYSNFCPLSYWIVLMVHVNFLFGSILIS